MAIIEAIETVYLEADAANITFSSLAGYEHLELIMSLRGTRTTSQIYTEATLNADDGSNYSTRRIHASGGNLYGQSTSSDSDFFNNYNSTSSGVSGRGDLYSYGRLTIYDYLHTNKNTTISEDWTTLLGDVSYGQTDRNIGVWDNTAAVTSIKLRPGSGSYNFLRGSTITLNGIKSS